jgi:hypothetical protein
MRNGMKPNVTIFKDGICNSVLLGYDMVAEHEWGIDKMKEQFCSNFVSFESMVYDYRKDMSLPTADQVLWILDKNLDRILFREDTEQEAFMFTTVPMYNSENRDKYIDEDFARLIKEGKSKLARRVEGGWTYFKENCNYQSAWDGSGFRMFGLGKKEFKRLKDFYKAIQAGTCVIVPSNLPMFRDLTEVGGLALVDKSRMAFEDAKEVAQNSVALLERIMLYANSKQEELMTLVNKTANSSAYIWPVMKEGKIVYNINPGYQMKAQYMGGYTEAQIRRWCAHKCDYQLTPASPE